MDILPRDVTTKEILSKCDIKSGFRLASALGKDVLDGFATQIKALHVGEILMCKAFKKDAELPYDITFVKVEQVLPKGFVIAKVRTSSMNSLQPGQKHITKHMLVIKPVQIDDTISEVTVIPTSAFCEDMSYRVVKNHVTYVFYKVSVSRSFCEAITI